MIDNSDGKIVNYMEGARAAPPIDQLAVMEDIKISKNEEFVKETLEHHIFEYEDHNGVNQKVSGDATSLLKQVFDDSQKIVTQNAKGDILPDYKSRAQMKLKLLEAMGVVKGKQAPVQVNFLNMLFGKQ